MKQILRKTYLATSVSCNLRMNLPSALWDDDSDRTNAIGQDRKFELTKEQPNENVLVLKKQFGEKSLGKKRKKGIFGRRDPIGW
uniref:Uncharacterized protein n=1 Tax=Parascaris equorum TaxID=6256 RepID=A0A914RVP2_PAREQ